jgi:hypothetical protein
MSEKEQHVAPKVAMKIDIFTAMYLAQILPRNNQTLCMANHMFSATNLASILAEGWKIILELENRANTSTTTTFSGMDHYSMCFVREFICIALQFFWRRAHRLCSKAKGCIFILYIKET